jgi:hypothetical protein
MNTCVETCIFVYVLDLFHVPLHICTCAVHAYMHACVHLHAEDKNIKDMYIYIYI